MDVERKLTKARLGLMFDQPFYGYLALSLQMVEKKELFPPTMATDGLRLFYHPDFVEKHTDAELRTVVAHEVGHAAFNHIPRRVAREPWRWNFAADYVDNSMIKQCIDAGDSGMVVIPGWLYDDKYDNMSVEEVYAKLPEEEESQDSGQGKGDKGGKSGKSGKGTLDSHAEWEDYGKGDKGGDNGPDSQAVKEAVEGLEQLWRERVAQAANAARSRGKLPAHLRTLIDGLLQPKLDWRAILRDMITSVAKNDYRWLPPNKKYVHQGLYLPSITGESISVAVAVDTSGSVSDDELREFLSEIHGICSQYDDYTVYLWAADAAVHDYWELTPMETFPKVLSGGRGGTDFRPAFAEADKKAGDFSVFVYLTDAEGPFPDVKPPYPVIFVLTPHHGSTPWGVPAITLPIRK